MIKVIRNTWVFIKATPRYFGDKSGAGSQSGGQDDDGNGGGHGYGDGKGRDDKAERKGKGDWKDSYSWPEKQAPWSNPGAKGGKRPSKWASEYDDSKQAQKEKDNVGEETKTTDTRKGTFSGQLDARAYPAGKAPEDWFVGQLMPNSYAINGSVDTWRAVQVGEKCQWSDRIARCTKQEYQMNQK
jgi:hypothetical protein